MKKNMLTLAFALSTLLFSTQLSAQESKLSLGFRANSSLSNYSLSGQAKSLKSKMGIGGSAGGFIKYDLTPNFAVQSGIDVYFHSSKLESTGSTSSRKLNSFGVEIPLYGIIQGELGSGKAFIGAGPYAGYGISAKLGGVSLFKENGTPDMPALNRFDYGVGGIIGYEFDQHWQLKANYQFGLADLDKAKGAGMKSRVASVGIAYKF